jgi:hypothetical protein
MMKDEFIEKNNKNDNKSLIHLKKMYINVISVPFLLIVQSFLIILLIYCYFIVKNDLNLVKLRLDSVCAKESLKYNNYDDSLLNLISQDDDEEQILNRLKRDLTTSNTSTTKPLNATSNNANQTVTIPEIILDDYFLKQISNKVDVIII